MTFSDFEFEYDLQDSLDAMRFETPTPVQEQTIPVIMEGRDIIACAQTGTGKTAAYLLPTINRIVREPQKGIDTVVLVPTRELALQIDQQMEGFGYYVQVSSVAVYGGNDSGEWNRQKNAILEGADILIATPGRLLQHISMGYVDFSTIRCLILDEADRMLDMGFYEDIMQVVNQMPVEGRQTLMFSATMPPKIRELAKNILRDPAEVNIAISKPAEGVKQGAYVVYDTQKSQVIRHILDGRQEQSVIVFSSRKQTVKELARELRRQGFNADVIHSDLEQKEREEALLKFRNRQTNILVATDIIARGIDIEKIDVVINYEVPHDAEDYVHRVGRTARAQTQGEAYTLVSEMDMYAFGQIEQLIEMTVEKLPLPEGLGEGPEYTPNKRVRGVRNGNGRQQRNGRNGDNRNRRRNTDVRDDKARHDREQEVDGEGRSNRRHRANSHRIQQEAIGQQSDLLQEKEQATHTEQQNGDIQRGDLGEQRQNRHRRNNHYQRRYNRNEGEGLHEQEENSEQQNYQSTESGQESDIHSRENNRRRPRRYNNNRQGGEAVGRHNREKGVVESNESNNDNRGNDGQSRNYHNGRRRYNNKEKGGNNYRERRGRHPQELSSAKPTVEEKKTGIFSKVKSALKGLFGSKG